MTITDTPKTTIDIEGVDVDAVQKRTLRVLSVSSVLSRGAASSTFPVAVLAIKELLGEENERWAGLSTAASTVGSAIAAAALAMIMQRRGRNTGLTLGLGTAVGGGLLAIIALQANLLVLFVLGLVLVGIGNGSSNLSRYAASDLATTEFRSRYISRVIFAATFGAVSFPLLIGVAGAIAESAGFNENAGGLAMGAVLFALSSAVIWVFMRPDPLIVSGGVDPKAGIKKRTVPFADAVKIAWAHPLARLAFIALVVTQAVMVMVMAMTPLHMKDHGHSTGWVGAVISAHTAGMFAFAPLAGWLSDRYGRVQIIVLAGFTLVGATTLTSLAGEAPRALLFPGLFLLGLGWSFGIVAGSALLTESVAEPDRVAVQGAAELAKNVASGTGAITAGLILSSSGYHILSFVAMAATGALLAQSWFENRLASLRT